MTNLTALLLALAVVGLGIRLLRYTNAGRSGMLAHIAMASAAGAAVLAWVLFIVGIAGGFTRGALWTLAFVLGVQAIPEWRRFWRERRPWRDEPVSVNVAALVLMALLATAWIFQNAPPLFFDTLVYHLGLPQQYLIRGSLVFLPNFHYSAMPGNVELFYVFGLALGDIPLARLLAFGGLVFGAAQVASLSNRWQPGSGTLAAVLAIGLPVSLFMGIHNGVDQWVAVFVCAAVLAALHWIEEGRPPDALWAGVFAGAALGAKYTALYHLAPLAVLAVIARTRRGGGLRTVAAPAAVALLAAVWIGGGWYVRNFVNTGNPVYPAFYSVLGGNTWSPAAAQRVARDVAHGGAGDLTLASAVRIPWDLVMNAELFGEFGKAGPLFWAILAVGMAGALRQRPLVPAWMAMVVPLWMMTSMNLRYVLPVLWVLAAAAGSETARWIAANPGVLKRRFVEAAIILFAATSIEWVTRFETEVFQVHRYFLGNLEYDRYLSRGADYYPIARLTAELPEDAVVLLMGETRLLYFERPVVVSSAYDESVVSDFVRRGGTVEGTLCEMSRAGITHFVYNPREATRLESGYDYFGGLTGEEIQVLAGLIPASRVIDVREEVALLALPPAETVCRPASAGTGDLL